MNALLSKFLILLAVVLAIASQAVFTVDQREQALVLQLGQPIGDVKGPGLHFKIPFVQDVRRFESRLLPVDPEPRQMVISSSLQALHNNAVNKQATTQNETGENQENAPVGIEQVSGEPIVVDTFSRYSISDPLKFMKTLRTINEATKRLEDIINDATRNVLGQRTLAELLSDERTEIMQEILQRVNKKVADDQLGVNITDIRIVRADLTADLRQSTVRRMISELRERATETRAKGEELALEIQSTAEKEREIILAESEKEAQILRGQGDREAIAIYINAFEKDEEFYEFMRSMEAYKNTLATPDTRLILSPKSEFFKHFRGRNQQGK